MSRPRGGSLDPPSGGQYITTTNKWTDHETTVMKKIHASYLRSLDVDEIQRLQDCGSKSDTEFFLPKDCSLRSDRGELVRPIWGGRGPFESHDEFISSIQFSYWVARTQDTFNVDEFMNDWAKTIIRDTCTEQAKDLRDKGSQVFGSSKHEHVSPLSLLLQDLKLWCVIVLRNGKTTDRDTFMEIGRRIKFLTYVLPKDVWSVGSKLNPFGKGLSKDSYHALSNCLQKVIQTLREVYDYCFKRYLQHLTFDKIGLILDYMQTEVYHVARFVSAVSTFDETVAGALERQLQPPELVEASVTQSHSDWTVLANVSLRYGFRDRLARAAMTGDMKKMDTEQDTAATQLKTWIASNPFIYRPRPDAPKAAQSAPAPDAAAAALAAKQANGAAAPPVLAFGDVLEDPKLAGFPSCFQACLDSLQKELAEGSTMFGSAVAKHVRYPLTKDKQVYSVKRAFPNDGDRAKVLRAIFKCIASLRDTIPSFFVLAGFTKVTGDDKKIVLDTVLRGELIRVLGEVCLRFAFVLASAKGLSEDMAEIAGAALAAQGKMDEAAQLLLNGPGVRRESSKKVAVTNRKGSVVGTKTTLQEVEDPIFVRNLDWASRELMPLVSDGAKVLFKQANQLASELHSFMIPAGRQIETPEERQCVTLSDLLVRIRNDDFTGTGFLVARYAPKRDYLNLSSKRTQEAFRFVSEECAFQVEPDSMAYMAALDTMDRDLQAALKPSAHEPDTQEDDVLEQLEKMEVNAPQQSSGRAASSATKGKQATFDLAPRMDDEGDEAKSDAGKAGKPKKRMSLFGKKLF